MNSNGYIPFLILLCTLPINSNGYVPFLINTLFWGGVKHPNCFLRCCFTRSRLPDVGVEETQHSRHAADPPRASGRAVPEALTLPEKGWVYRLAPEVPLFRGISINPEAFFKPPGVSRLRPCALTHLKKGLGLNSSGCWVIRQIGKI